MKIELKFKNFTELPIKRLYLPILPEIQADCPKCGDKAIFDADQQYISYPEVGKKESIPFYCDTCDDHFDKEYIFNLTVTLDDATRTT